jgi:hypothetical protein
VAQGAPGRSRGTHTLTIDNVAVAVLCLILVVPLGSAWLAYRAHRETRELRGQVDELRTELAYWRETGGRLMEGLVRENDAAPRSGRGGGPVS